LFLVIYAGRILPKWPIVLAFAIAAAFLASARAQEPASASRFVGSTTCAACHAKESAAWQGSRHRQAMQVADAKTMLGNFNGAQFNYAGVTSTFTKRDGKFFARTDGPDGKLHDYEVRYTFGVDPLQQYLIEFPDGRFQALSIAWDVEKKRWFHLYPKQHVDSADELHWTRPSQNWNYMCADCHSTALRKNYDAGANRFRTQWSEISVGCEACHGPGSAHVAWASAGRDGKPYADDGSKGLAARLDERRGVAWARDGSAATATRSKPRATEHEIDVCAQ